MGSGVLPPQRILIASSTTVTTATVARGADTSTLTSRKPITFASTSTGTSFSSGRIETVVCPCARAARWRALAATLCTTDTYTSRFGASSAFTGRSFTSLVAFVRFSTSV